MIEPGRVCIKRTGRDSGKKCVIINVLDKKFVEIVSETRRKARRCNVFHLLPLSQKVDPKSEAEINKVLGIKEKKVPRAEETKPEAPPKKGKGKEKKAKETKKE